MTKTITPTIVCPKCGVEIPLTDALLYPFQQEWKKQLEPELRQKLDAEKREEVKELQTELEEKSKKLEEAQSYERKLRKERKEVEDREKNLDLEVARKLDEARKKIGEQYDIKLVEKDKQISGMKRQIDELERKSEQISPQIKGDALQYELDRMLEESFPEDEVEVIKRGVKGADIVQRVKDRDNRLCGTILWESKNTRRWNDSWIEKLKNDQRAQKADIAVLASVAIPEDIQNFGMKEGVWVTCLPLACCLADVLRFSIIELAANKLALVSKDQKIETLYTYFASPQFKQRIEPIVEALSSMQAQTNRERQAMERIWAEREKEIEKAIKGAAGFYGDIRGIIGRAFLPEIDRLQLLPPAED